MPLFGSLEHVRHEVNGHRCEGWADDEAALDYPDIDAASVMRGADGKLLAISSANRGGPVVYKFLANSRSVKFFMQQAAVVQRGGRVVFNATEVDEQTGLSAQLRNGVLTSYPSMQDRGKGSASNREFTIEYEEIIQNYDGAEFTGVPEVAN